MLDEELTTWIFPPVYYYLGRAQEGMHDRGAAGSYRQFLDIRGQATPMLSWWTHDAASARDRSRRIPVHARCSSVAWRIWPPVIT